VCVEGGAVILGRPRLDCPSRFPMQSRPGLSGVVWGVMAADAQGMGVVFVRGCNHFGWGPAYALEHLDDELLVGNITQVRQAPTVGPEAGPASAFSRGIPAGIHGPVEFRME
jgi:hypothetical protein